MKASILENANKELKKVQIKISVAKAAEERHKKALAVIESQKSAGTYVAPGDEDSKDSWVRDTRRGEARANLSQYE